MNKTTRLLGSLLIITIATSCGTGDKNQSAQTDDPLANSPIVGQYVQAGTDNVMSCDQKLLADTVRIPLSFLTEKLEIVKLDSRDEALVGQTGVTISDNYILVHGRRPNPFKLFDRKGNFLTNIGAIGQGPGEYQMVYDAKLDEANNRIYILPWNASQLLVYDLQGNVLDPIPLCLRCPKAKFNVDLTGGKVSIVLLPFKGSAAVAWTQDLKGNRLGYMEPGHLEAPQDFSNEVISGFNIPGTFDVNILCIMPTRVDSLYRYDGDNSRLIPTFTLNFANTDKIPCTDTENGHTISLEISQNRRLKSLPDHGPTERLFITSWTKKQEKVLSLNSITTISAIWKSTIPVMHSQMAIISGISNPVTS